LNKTILFSLLQIIVVWGLWFYYTYPSSVQVISENWPITFTMVFGSFIAGATSEGGGAIAFPVFTKILHISPIDAKVFSLAIQSVGMLAATLTIIVLRITVEWRVILWASLGGILGVLLGSLIIAPLLPADLLKMLFTAMISSFALTLVLLNWKQRLYNSHLLIFSWHEKRILLITGFIGGCMTGLVGNGIDIICFSVMVLLFRLSEKVSTATSVVLMAFNSLIGFLIHLFIMGGFTSEVKAYWLAAIPVVVVGAPLGAYFCTRLNNKTIATILITLIAIELTSSIYLIPLNSRIINVSVTVFLLFCFIYFKLSRVTRYNPNRKVS